MVPEYIVMLTSVSLSHNGKMDVKNLPFPTEADKWNAKTDNGYVAPTTQLESTICSIFAQVLESDVKIGKNHNFFNFGGNSVLAINCIQLIKKQKIGESLTVPQFYNNSTPEKLATLLTSGDREKTYVQLMYSPKTPQQKPRKLFLVPGAIRTSLVFTQLVESLPENFPYEVYSFTDPDGLLDGANDPQTMSDLVEPYMNALFKIQPRNTGVYYIMGYSVGGLVAMELSNWLMDMGNDVKLIMADTRNPTKSLLDLDISAIHAMLAEELGLRYNYNSALTAAVLAQYSELDQQAMLAAEIVDHKILDETAAEKLVEKCIDYFKTATRILGKYHVPKIDIPVTLLSASQNRFQKLEAAVQQQQPQQQTAQHDLGWGAILGKWLNIVKVPGDHFTMLLKPHVCEFARVLLQELSRPTHSGKTIKAKL